MKIIQFIDRILWGSTMASLTSPTFVGGYMPHDEMTAPSAASTQGNESYPAVRTQPDVTFADAN